MCNENEMDVIDGSVVEIIMKLTEEHTILKIILELQSNELQTGKEVIDFLKSKIGL